jgi:hypothetical protein
MKEQQETIEAGKHMEESYLKSSIMFSVIHQWTARILSVHGQRNSELVESVSNVNAKLFLHNVMQPAQEKKLVAGQVFQNLLYLKLQKSGICI